MKLPDVMAAARVFSGSFVSAAWIATIMLAIVVGLFALANAFHERVASIDLVFGEAVDGVQLFVASDGGFSERGSSSMRYPARSWRIHVPRSQIGTLRLDPPAGLAVSLCSLSVDAGGHRLSLADYRVVGAHQLSSYGYVGSCLSVVPTVDGNDPQLLLEIRPEREMPPASDLPILAAIAAGAVALVGILALVRRHRINERGPSRDPSIDPITRNLVGVYVGMSIVLGASYALVTPPGAVPDEYAHVTKAVKMTHGVLAGPTGDRLFPNVYAMYGPFDGYLDPSVRFSVIQWLTQVSQDVICEPSTAALPAGADSYAPHLYLAPAASYAFACATGQSVGTFLLLARIGNLLLATALIAFGLWATLRARWVLFVCALLPMTLYQVASVSVDAIYFGLTFAWLGVVSGVLEGRISLARATWFLWPLSLLLAVSKPGAAWVLGAILFVLPRYRRERGTFWPALLKYLLVPFAIHTVWVIYSAGSAAPLEGVDPAANVSLMGSDPGEVLKTVWQTFTGAHGLWLWKGTLGLLGWLDVYLAPLTYVALTCCLFASLSMSPNGGPAPLYVAPAAVLMAFGAMLMLALPLFIFWTLPESSIVMGLQGRYFIPCVVFAGCFLVRGQMPRLRTALATVLPVVLAMASVDGLVALIARYYP